MRRFVFFWLLSFSIAYANTENVDAVVQDAYAHRGVFEAPYQKQIEDAVKRAPSFSLPYQKVAWDAKSHPTLLMQDTYKSQANPTWNSPVLIFVSFSMPNESLMSYLEDAKKIHAQVVIRGLIDHSFKKTVARMKTLLEKTQVGVVLDPKLFNQFGVLVVPQIVVLKDANLNREQSLAGDVYDSVIGNVSLEYALNLMARTGDAKRNAQIALDQLRGLNHV